MCDTAETVRSFKVSKPKYVRYIAHGGGGTVYARLEWSPDFVQKAQGALLRAQKKVDEECIDRMTDKRIHPFRTGELAGSAKRSSVIGSGLIVQPGPYARRQYYEHKKYSRWFETMKNRDKDVILRTAQNALDGK